MATTIVERDGGGPKKGTNSAEDRVDETLMGPGEYEVSPDTTFDVYVKMVRVSGRWVVVEGDVKDAVVEKVIFRMWTFDEAVDMRKQSTSFHPETKQHLLDDDKLNRLKVQKLLLSWTFGRGNKRLEISHVDGVLTDESWRAMKRLQSNILSYILRKMNDVFERGR